LLLRLGLAPHSRGRDKLEAETHRPRHFVDLSDIWIGGFAVQSEPDCVPVHAGGEGDRLNAAWVGLDRRAYLGDGADWCFGCLTQGLLPSLSIARMSALLQPIKRKA
jgi:hypothetical protein